jgi:hypothetical protein
MDIPGGSQSGGVKNSKAEIVFERVLAVWQDSKAPSSGRLLIVFFSGLAVICGATAFVGAVPTKIYGHDVFVWLAGGWRAINGQRPHLDFTSPWGPVMFMVSGLGLTISHHSVNGIGYGSAIVALIVGCWSFFLGKNRLASSPRVVLSLFLSAMVAAPYPLGLSPFFSSHAMLYNRYGYALLGLILLECFTVAHHPTGSHVDELIGGVSTGVALGLMLFLKVSYFLVAVGLIGVVSLFLGRFVRQRILGIVLGVSFVSVAMLAYLRFAVAAMLGDLRMAAATRSGALGSPFWIGMNHGSVLLGVLCFCLVASLILARRLPQWGGWKLPILGAFFFVTDVGLIMSNAQVGDFPVCAVFAILLVNEITQYQQTLRATEAHSNRPAYAAALCLGGLLFIPQFTSDLTGLAYGAWSKQRPAIPTAVVRFTSPNLKPLLLYENPGNPPGEGRMFTTYVNDGVALLERETRPNETIHTMDATNPFPYAMERRPPRGGHAGAWYPYTITVEHRPSDDWYFGDADIVMVPKQPSQGGSRSADIYKAYEPGLKQRYNFVAESSLWRMYRRK